MYLIQSYYNTRSSITQYRYVGYVETLAQAKQVVAEKNKRALYNTYGYVKLRNLKCSKTTKSQNSSPT